MQICVTVVKLWQYRYPDAIIKPPESGGLFEEITEFVVVEDLPPTTNKVVSTYSTSDKGGFVFISYKREAYGQPETQGMLYCIYYELNQCPLPLQFSHQPLFTSLLVHFDLILVWTTKSQYLLAQFLT